MEFESPRFIWHLANVLILIAIIVSVFIVPAWIFRKVNSVEGLLKGLNRKLDDMMQSKKNSD